MKLLTAFILFLFATNVIARDIQYTLEVKGMVCAYCAYNVSKQLQSIDGVIPTSVDVNLGNGVVTLQSSQPLQKAELFELLRSAGFELGVVKETAITSVATSQESPGSPAMSVTINIDQLVDGQFDDTLEALGTFAAVHSASIRLTAPDKIEAAILRPVLAGRKVLIQLEYVRVPQPQNTVLIDLFID